ncbi:L-type lectin-domain containing receptor kinase IX.1 [Manihot esculenta]|uniref:Protein kinase domain-containing protein n=1 Tax=Manihot esculenta TaxID=3983 RepID=A0A2C9UW38_MANES|nr:L-type lectin-domain containing receptor kinase IX.1 [Manihot esculenta]
MSILSFRSFLLLLLLPSADSLSFRKTRFDAADTSFIYEGGAAVFVGAIELNNDAYQCQVGRATYIEKVQIWDSKTQKLSDFTTRFTSTVDIQRRLIYGSGFTFFLAPVGFQVPTNSAGGFLGLYNVTTINSPNQILHIEFDTNPDPDWDPQFEHVAININSLYSSTYTRWNVTLHSGDNTDVLINYNSRTKNLSVSWRFLLTGTSQEITSLSTIVDLREVLPEWVTIGFSSATRDYVERHAILSWEFTSSLDTDDGNQTNAKKIRLVVLLVLAACVLIGAVVIALSIWWTKKMMVGIKDTINLTSLNDDLERGRGLQRFSYNELALATNNFSTDTKLGEGEYYYSVHKGHLPRLKMSVAVTKYLGDLTQTKKEYITGMKIISRLRDQNLLQLLGWCHEEGKLLLVYEFLPKGSLDSHLFGNRTTTLPCDVRYRATLALASALVFLHEELEQCLVHGDVNASNITLDSNFNAKLCHFGLARLLNHELVSQNTGEASRESDVYGFGVVALEIATGRRVLDPIEDRPEISLVEWVWDHYRNKTLRLAVDRRLNMDFDEKQMEYLMIVGLWCAQQDHGSRPSMRQAIHVLNFNAVLPNLPIN